MGLAPESHLSDESIGSEMKALLQAKPPSTVRPLIEFAATWFDADLPATAKFQFLMTSRAHFEQLRAWFQEHKLAQFGRYLEDEFKAESQTAFLMQCRLLSKKAVEWKNMKSPVVKSLIENLAALHSCAKALPEKKNGAINLRSICFWNSPGKNWEMWSMASPVF